MNWCASAIFAVSVSRGSTTTMRPPRLRTSLRRLPGCATCRKVHFDTIGLVPTISMYFTWSRSTKGWVKGKPYISVAAAKRLAQSWVEDENTLCEPRPFMKPSAKIGCNRLKPAAVPTYIEIASGLTARRPFTLAPISA